MAITSNAQLQRKIFQIRSHNAPFLVGPEEVIIKGIVK